ncbi:MAG: class I SAM-dependent methyltransferase [Spartobacteria bacterium]|nr:class I SAM-dependent methyltransferase [Spartobacteria bacterium]
MALYDRYTDVMQGHPAWVQRMEAVRQERILMWVSAFLPKAVPVRALEVGVGIGMFARACAVRRWDYTGVDRNARMVTTLSGQGCRVVEGECPPLPDAVTQAPFDLAYSSFVLEHTTDGTEAFAFVSALVGALAPGGVLALVVPDALSLGMEFWNLDYTHRYPTAERNVAQILMEAGLDIRRVVRYRGAGWTGWRYALAHMAGWFYYYPFWQRILRNPTLPYSVYQYLKQDVLVFIACRAH